MEVAICACPEFQQNLEGSMYKTKMYAELADALAKAELASKPRPNYELTSNNVFCIK